MAGRYCGVLIGDLVKVRFWLLHTRRSSLKQLSNLRLQFEGELSQSENN
jgi:hypothetical protein